MLTLRRPHRLASRPARPAFDDLFGLDWDRLFRFDDAWPRWLEPAGASSFHPAVDVEETKDAFLVHADLPGLGDKDVDVKLHDGVLELSGQRASPEDSARRPRIHERSYGRFVRRFRVGPQVDASKVEAKFKDGVLTVTLPKTEKAQPRQIPIH